MNLPVYTLRRSKIFENLAFIDQTGHSSLFMGLIWTIMYRITYRIMYRIMYRTVELLLPKVR